MKLSAAGFNLIATKNQEYRFALKKMYAMLFKNRRAVECRKWPVEEQDLRMLYNVVNQVEQLHLELVNVDVLLSGGRGAGGACG